jgi:hypothetical protein
MIESSNSVRQDEDLQETGSTPSILWGILTDVADSRFVVDEVYITCARNTVSDGVGRF